MASKTEIANMAISHLGIGKEIANVDTEKSQEARACRSFYESAKKITLSDLDWNFASTFATLGLVEEDPTTEYRYSYQYPTDCLRLRRILSGSRQDTQQSRIPYRIVVEGGTRKIYTDQDSAVVEYTTDITDASIFDSEFAMALSYRLAAFICSRLTAGDDFRIKAEMLQHYQMEIGFAKKKNMNEVQHDRHNESDLIRSRGGARDRISYDRYEL